MTRKLQTFMDFSVILNKNKPLNADETGLGLDRTNLGNLNVLNMTNNLWDISNI